MAAEPVIPERRKHPRFQLELPARINVLLEELTFSPLQFEGTFLNISRAGALAVVRGLTKEAYIKMIQRPRYVRAVCQLPESEKPITLFGKLVWYDYQSEAGGSVCRLAITFEQMREEVCAALDRGIELLQGSESPGGVGASPPGRGGP